ncbi:MAG: hypothetical protein ACOCP8_00145 [archaeon]
MYIEIKHKMIFERIFNILNKPEWEPFVLFYWDEKTKNETDKEYIIKLNKTANLSEYKFLTSSSNYNSLPAFNASIFIVNNVIDSIVKLKDLENHYNNLFNELMNFKSRWFKSVTSFYKKNNSTKYILKEVLDSGQGFDKVNEFYNEILKDILLWRDNYKPDTPAKVVDTKLIVNNKKEKYNSLRVLSDFRFLSDLTKAQIKVILRTDPYLIILHEILKNNNDLLKYIKKQEIETSLPKPAPMPISVMINDICFQNKKISLDDSNIVEETEDYYIYTIEDNNQSIIRIPKNSNELGFKPGKTISTGKLEIAVFAALLQIANNRNIINEKWDGHLYFSCEDVCRELGYTRAGKTYYHILEAINNLNLLSSPVVLDEIIKEITLIVTKIKPRFNHKRQKEYGVRFHDELVDAIIANKIINTYAIEFSRFRSDIAALIFKIILVEISKGDTTEFYFTESTLSKKIGLNKSPAMNKIKLIGAFKELQKAGLIDYFEFNHDTYVFYVKSKTRDEQIRLLSSTYENILKTP